MPLKKLLEEGNPVSRVPMLVNERKDKTNYLIIGLWLVYLSLVVTLLFI